MCSLFDAYLEKDALGKFLNKVRGDNQSVERLEYTPLERRMVASYLLDELGEEFGVILRGIIHDRDTGGYTLGLESVTEDSDEFVIFSTAISHIIGTPNHDSMSGKYYARFEVKDTDNSDAYLRQAYRLFTLHTDGTFADEPTDWLIMHKMFEENAVGGESRLLHPDDWREFENYANHPLASYKFHYKAPKSKNVDQEVHRPTFFKQNDKACICFFDQFVYPESIEQAKYLRGLSESMEKDDNIEELDLPVGNLVALNNLFWLHGRAAFEKNKDHNRELLRIRGHFND
ncbi:glutarate dioxygenase GlaH [Sporosarcina sp. P13]|uniref:glutarate dioxygenase GlaH n=1 Tax=Sporosarcina sp. P13 TaxID=2048263 RepID=UPI003513CF0F